MRLSELVARYGDRDPLIVSVSARNLRPGDDVLMCVGGMGVRTVASVTPREECRVMLEFESGHALLTSAFHFYFALNRDHVEVTS